jgi:hypothetical protein
MIFQFFQRYGQAMAPVRVFMNRPREIDLISYSQDVLYRNASGEARGGGGLGQMIRTYSLKRERWGEK